MVWRMLDGSDAFDEDCIGPSRYSKAQGEPVRIWGFLIAGTFYVDILPEKEVMNQWYYSQLIEEKVETWVSAERICDLLASDYEGLLRTDEALASMRAAGISLLGNYPISSQDLNPVENVWNLLRQRLDHTQPTTLEPRDRFIQRLTAAVKWLNSKAGQKDALRDLWMDQKARARMVLNAEPPGSRIDK